MSTPEDRLSQDLAIVASMSRERLLPLEVTLRSVGAATLTTAPQLALVVLARVFVARVGRAAAGLASFACMFAMLVWLALPRGDGWIEHYGVDRGMSVELLETPRWWLGLVVVAVALAVYVGASGIAARTFERTVAGVDNPIDAARRLAHRSEVWSTAASISGSVTFIVGFGAFQVVVGDAGLIALYSHSAGIEAIRHVMLVSLAGSCAATAGGAIFVTRTYRDGSGFHRITWMLPVGIVLGIATFVLGVRFDAGPLFVTIANSARPIAALRVGLTAAGTLAVFLVATSIVLRLRRCEGAVVRSAVGRAPFNPRDL
jgi:hypothetical protein